MFFFSPSAYACNRTDNLRTEGYKLSTFWHLLTKKKLGKRVTAIIISRGLIGVTPLWQFLCRRQCDYPTLFVLSFHTSKQWKFTRNQIGLEYTTRAGYLTAKKKKPQFCPLLNGTNQGLNIIDFWEIYKRGNRLDCQEQWGHCSHPTNPSKYLWHQIDDRQKISFQLSDVLQWKRKSKTYLGLG